MKNTERLGGKLIIQGADAGIKDVRDGERRGARKEATREALLLERGATNYTARGFCW